MVAILIPAYQPDVRLIKLVEQLILHRFTHIIVVDDGSRTESASSFSAVAAMGCTVLRHSVNKGKGAAIKTAIRHAHETLPGIEGYVTCDADGQHTPEDIERIATELDRNPDALVLGMRDFSGPDVPKKSRFGNAFSSFYFRMSTGKPCRDTQTGLRGIPVAFTELALGVEGNRYDYEMTFLLAVAEAGHRIIDLPIATVYLEANASSHFRPVVDSFRIYREPLKFAFVSLLSALVDIVLFAVLNPLLVGHVLYAVGVATIIARIVSGTFNFLLNRIWSFRNYNSLLRQFKRYFLLYIANIVLSITFVTLLSMAFVPSILAKVVVDGTLFVFGFFVQKRWVFVKGAKRG